MEANKDKTYNTRLIEAVFLGGIASVIAFDLAELTFSAIDPLAKQCLKLFKVPKPPNYDQVKQSAKTVVNMPQLQNFPLPNQSNTAFQVQQNRAAFVLTKLNATNTTELNTLKPKTTDELVEYYDRVTKKERRKIAFKRVLRILLLVLLAVFVTRILLR